MIARDKQLAKLEKQYYLKLLQHFTILIRDITAKTIKTLSTKASEITIDRIAEDIYPDTAQWRSLHAEIHFEFGLETIKQAAEFVAAFDSLPYDFSLIHAGAISWLKNRVTETANQVNETLYNLAREIIARNLDDKVTDISKIKDEIARTLEEEKDWRVERIVRSELIDAYNQGTYREYEASKLVEKIQWLTAEDERVCPICAPNHLTIRKMGKEFPSGHTIPKAHIQCRCNIRAYFGD